MTYNTKDLARCALLLALTNTRKEEQALRHTFLYPAGDKEPIKSCAVDFGGVFVDSVSKIIERAVAIARKEKLYTDEYRIEGAIAGATHEAINQISLKALGLNVGGKIGIAMSEQDVAVCIFFAIGMMHLDEVVVGLGHRAI